jgi:hypothetical protein
MNQVSRVYSTRTTGMSVIAYITKFPKQLFGIIDSAAALRSRPDDWYDQA